MPSNVLLFATNLININLMANNTTFHVIPEINMSLASENELKKIYAILKKFEITFTKITKSQRLAVFGIDDNTMDSLRLELLKVVPLLPKISVTYIQTCPSLQNCIYATRDTQKLGRKLEQLNFNSPLPGKVKIGIAGCKMCCTEPWVRDIGIISSRKGWSLIFGGNAGNRPRIGDLIAENLNEEDIIQLVKKCLSVYHRHALPKHRTARFMETYGLEKFRKAIE